MSECYYNKLEYEIVTTKDGFIDIEPAVLTDLTLVIEYNGGNYIDISDDEINEVIKENADHSIGIIITKNQTINKCIRHKIHENDLFLKMMNKKIKIVDNMAEIPLVFFDSCYISDHLPSGEKKIFNMDFHCFCLIKHL